MPPWFGKLTNRAVAVAELSVVKLSFAEFTVAEHSVAELVEAPKRRRDRMKNKNRPGIPDL